MLFRRRITRFLDAAVIAALVGALLALGVADRLRWTTILICIPVLPIGLGVLAWDLLRRGRTLRRPRFAVSLFALGIVSWSTYHMIGWQTPSPARDPVRVIHWNVRWGGGGGRAEAWPSIVREIVAQKPDIVLLSEAPKDDVMLEDLQQALGRDWALQVRRQRAGDAYWYGLAVLARWPVEVNEHHAVENGAFIVATVQRDLPLRVILADGQNPPWRWRVPTVRYLLDICERDEAAGRRIALIAGDFNTPGPGSVAFEPLSTRFRLASDVCDGWRGTWPAAVPLFDIDHVFVHREHSISGCSMLYHSRCDHRGQLVLIDAPPINR